MKRPAAHVVLPVPVPASATEEDDLVEGEEEEEPEAEATQETEGGEEEPPEDDPVQEPEGEQEETEPELDVLVPTYEADKLCLTTGTNQCYLQARTENNKKHLIVAVSKSQATKAGHCMRAVINQVKCKLDLKGTFTKSVAISIRDEILKL